MDVQRNLWSLLGGDRTLWIQGFEGDEHTIVVAPTFIFR